MNDWIQMSWSLTMSGAPLLWAEVERERKSFSITYCDEMKARDGKHFLFCVLHYSDIMSTLLIWSLKEPQIMENKLRMWVGKQGIVQITEKHENVGEKRQWWGRFRKRGRKKEDGGRENIFDIIPSYPKPVCYFFTYYGKVPCGGQKVTSQEFVRCSFTSLSPDLTSSEDETREGRGRDRIF